MQRANLEVLFLTFICLILNLQGCKMTDNINRLFLAYDYRLSITWGGFHITLIGKGNKMSFNNVKRTSLYN
jgi:hypothetical protein